MVFEVAKSFSLAGGTQSRFTEGWSEARRSNLGIAPANESRYLGWVEMRALATTHQVGVRIVVS
jgi:hypothetical protein